jgi:hypothetical protein
MHSKNKPGLKSSRTRTLFSIVLVDCNSDAISPLNTHIFLLNQAHTRTKITVLNLEFVATRHAAFQGPKASHPTRFNSIIGPGLADAAGRLPAAVHRPNRPSSPQPRRASGCRPWCRSPLLPADERRVHPGPFRLRAEFKQVPGLGGSAAGASARAGSAHWWDLVHCGSSSDGDAGPIPMNPRSNGTQRSAGLSPTGKRYAMMGCAGSGPGLYMLLEPKSTDLDACQAQWPGHGLRAYGESLRGGHASAIS